MFTPKLINTLSKIQEKITDIPLDKFETISKEVMALDALCDKLSEKKEEQSIFTEKDLESIHFLEKYVRECIAKKAQKKVDKPTGIRARFDFWKAVKPYNVTVEEVNVIKDKKEVIKGKREEAQTFDLTTEDLQKFVDGTLTMADLAKMIKPLSEADKELLKPIPPVWEKETSTDEVKENKPVKTLEYFQKNKGKWVRADWFTKHEQEKEEKAKQEQDEKARADELKVEIVKNTTRVNDIKHKLEVFCRKLLSITLNKPVAEETYNPDDKYPWNVKSQANSLISQCNKILVLIKGIDRACFHKHHGGKDAISNDELSKQLMKAIVDFGAIDSDVQTFLNKYYDESIDIIHPVRKLSDVKLDYIAEQQKNKEELIKAEREFASTIGFGPRQKTVGRGAGGWFVMAGDKLGDVEILTAKKVGMTKKRDYVKELKSLKVSDIKKWVVSIWNHKIMKKPTEAQKIKERFEKLGLDG